MRKLAVLLGFVIASVQVSGQDFGFGFAGTEDEAETAPSSSGAAPSAKISGEVSALVLGYLEDIAASLGETALGNVFTGKLNITASAFNADGVINLKLKPPSTPNAPKYARR
jgi:hypothetical protein